MRVCVVLVSKLNTITLYETQRLLGQRRERRDYLKVFR